MICGQPNKMFFLKAPRYFFICSLHTVWNFCLMNFWRKDFKSPFQKLLWRMFMLCWFTFDFSFTSQPDNHHNYIAHHIHIDIYLWLVGDLCSALIAIKFSLKEKYSELPVPFINSYITWIFLKMNRIQRGISWFKSGLGALVTKWRCVHLFKLAFFFWNLGWLILLRTDFIQYILIMAPTPPTPPRSAPALPWIHILSSSLENKQAIL